MILDIRNANSNFESEQSERPDLDQKSAPKHAGFASPPQDRGWVRVPGDEPQLYRVHAMSRTHPKWLIFRGVLSASCGETGPIGMVLFAPV